MTTGDIRTNEADASDRERPEEQFDVVIVGAGFAGLYMLHRVRKLGLRVVVVEAGTDVGGTWYWNRYPGARCDVPSMEYSLSFDDDLQQEWVWSEVMSPQPEILAYAQHIADRFDLRRDIRFETKVTSAHYDDAADRWRLTTNAGHRLSARFTVMATGALSASNLPNIEGRDDFAGPLLHTGEWPKEPVDLAGKRVGIIGTGSSGVQAIPVLAEQAGHLHVFQRTPVYTFPANNRPLRDDIQQAYKDNYAEVRDRQRESVAGFSGFSPRKATASKDGASKDSKPKADAAAASKEGAGSGRVDPDIEAGLIGPGAAKNEQSARAPSVRRQRSGILDLDENERWEAVVKHGPGIFGSYRDVYTDTEANDIACDLYRRQVAKIVTDPVVADRLQPKDYPLGCKRQVYDTNYYETFNRSNVTLVDLQADPLERITTTGVQLENEHVELDVLVFATGFDAMTGALDRIDIRGRGGHPLRDEWSAGPRTYLGLAVAGFPNMFTITGPGSPSVLSNVLVSIEQHVDWLIDCFTHLADNDHSTIEATLDAQNEWGEHVNEVASGTMYTAPNCGSWYLGANIEGKPRVFMPYVGGVGRYRGICDEVAAEGYRGFVLT